MDDYGQMRDEELAGLAQAGDERAFETLFERHASTLRRQIRVRLPRLLRRKIDASDVVQMAYLGVHRSLDSFEPRGDGSYRAWLDQIVEHKLQYVMREFVGTAKRGLASEETGVSHQGAPHSPSRDPSPSAVAVGAELQARMESALAELPEHYREVIDLVQAQGLTLAQAGAQMGRSAGAAEKLYGRALSQLSRAVTASEEPR